MKQNYERQEAAHAARKAAVVAVEPVVAPVAAEIAVVEVIDREVPTYEEQAD